MDLMGSKYDEKNGFDKIIVLIMKDEQSDEKILLLL